jgi:hypothetical protein
VAASLSFISLIALCASAGDARANGRFPQANQLAVDPSDASRIVIRGTYGAVQSNDAGKTWRWICEESLGFVGIFDPAIALPSNGAILVGLPDALTRSTDRGCNFGKVAGPPEKKYVIDLAVFPPDPKRVVFVTSPVNTAPGTQATFATSTDDGASWVEGTPLPEDFQPYTVEIAPSRAERVYASGRGPFPLFGIVARSDDGGATWEQVTFDLKGHLGVYISAIDKTNPDILYARFDGEPGDSLRVSTDRGTSWQEIFAGKGELLGFAMSPDGTKIAIGGPTDGVHVAKTSDRVFTKASNFGARCLTWAAAGLYGCGAEASDGFSAGISVDDGKTYTALFRAKDLEPLACPQGSTTQSTCPAAWPEVQRSLLGGPDAGADAAPANDASMPDAGPPPPPPATTTCGCRAAPREPSLFHGALLPAVVALCCGLRRRRRLARDEVSE